MKGKAQLFNFESGIQGQPFLDNVYKSFGLSANSQHFLYLKAERGLPTFALYSHDLGTGTETRITDAPVHHAEWSPVGNRIAYMAMEGGGARFRLLVHDLESGDTHEVAAGRLVTDFIEWSPDARELLYVTVEPASKTGFESREYRYTLHHHYLAEGGDREIPGAESGRFNGGRLIVAGKQVPSPYRTVPNPGGEPMGRFVARGSEIYANLTEKGRFAVKRRSPVTGDYEFVTYGMLYASTARGIVVRDFTPDGTEYKYIRDGASQPSETVRIAGGAISSPARTYSTAAVTNAPRTAPGTDWKLPYYGQAALVQGGVGFGGGACDGVACFITAHFNELTYALDFQQVSESNQGNQRMLAVEAGTVSSTVNGVTCSTNPICLVSNDAYSATCNDPNSGLGNFVMIAHIDGTYSFYAHLKSGSVQVTAGQAVSQGTYLGDQGHSGAAGSYNNYRVCGDHLHFQRQVGPAPWAQSIPTDFVDAPCLMGCTGVYTSTNVELAPAPGITSITPASGLAGTSVPVTIDGTNFLYGLNVSATGTGVTVSNIALVSATQATATLTLASNAAGTSNISVSTVRGVSGTVPFVVGTSTSVTVTSVPVGLTVNVDGTSCTTPCARAWASGSSHTIGTSSPLAGATGVQYLWTNWSDGGAMTHSVTAPATATTYTANFTTQYALTTNASPAAGGSISPASGWVNIGTSLTVSATANAGYTFAGFTGSLTGLTNPQAVSMTAPLSITANFTLTGGGGGGWYSSSWSNRKAVTLDRTKVSGAANLVNFPVLFTTTDANLRSTANGGSVGKADGTDMLFTSADGATKLDHELESYNPATGAVTAWVRVPALSPAADTVVYLYYGNAAATDQQNRAGVWDSNYKGVWHLNTSTTAVPDSTSNANNGSKPTAASPGATAGLIGGGQSFNGTTDRITVPDSTSLDMTTATTISAWVRPSGWPNDWGNGIVNKEGNYALRSGNVAATDFDMLWWHPSGQIRYARTTPPSTGAWHYVVGQANANDAYRIYVDGVLVASTPGLWAVDGLNLSYPLFIGASYDPGFFGLIDEVRISSVARSQDWVVTEYRNQSAPSTFYSIGQQESNSGGGPVAAPVFNPAAGSYTGTQNVAITSATAGASIRYTNDGSTPTATTGTLYTAPVAVASSSTLRAIAFKAGSTDSAVVSAAYVITPVVAVTVTSSPVGLSLTVDSAACTTPCSFNWGVGTAHTIAAAAVIPGATGVQQVWTDWSDGGAISHSVTAPASAITYTATYKTQYTVTTVASPAAGGTISPATGWFDGGSSVAVSATANAGYNFTGFTGGLTGSTSPQNLTVTAPVTVTANFTVAATVAAPVFTPPAGSYNGTQNVAITSATVGASIRYTTDGSVPTSTSGILYTGPVAVASSMTLQAIAFKAGSTDSAVVSAAYVITPVVAVTVTSSPVGLSLTVDSAACTTPCSFNWGVGTAHTIAAAAVIPGATGVQQVWTDWSDGGAISHSVTAPAWAITYTATYKTQYTVTTVASPAAGGTISPATGWFDGGSPVAVSATANAGYNFTGFAGGLTGTTSPQNLTVTAPVTVTANFTVAATVAAPVFTPPGGSYNGTQNVAITSATAGASIRYTTDGSVPTSGSGILYAGPVAVASSTTLRAIAYQSGSLDSAVVSASYVITPMVAVTLASSPAGMALSADGVGCTSPCSLQWAVGSSHTIAATSVVSGGTGIQRVWANWSDGGAVSHTVTAPSSATTYTASYTTQYMLTTQASPTAGGTISPASGWFNSGAVVSVSATVNPGYTFSGFTGGLTGTTNPQSVTMTAPVTVTANFSLSGVAWYSTGGVWTNRKLITFDRAQVSGSTALANFPILFSVTDANLRSTANGGSTGKPDGTDILFTASDGITKLSHELESYDAATGAVVAWVKIPSLSPAANTLIYVYYGNAAAADQQNRTAVWDANYRGVWHLNSATTAIADSTSNANNGTKPAPAPAAGKMGGAQSFDGAANRITIPDSNSLDSTNTLTVEAWINASGWPNNWGNAIVNKEGDYAIRSGDVAASQFDMMSWRGSTIRVVRTTPPAAGVWHHVVGQISAGDAYRLYVDGVLVASSPVSWANDPRSLTNPLMIGGSYDPGFLGAIDEVRISSVVRSQNWIVTQYRNQNSPATFYSVGPQQ